jgi:hypothetical protein
MNLYCTKKLSEMLNQPVEMIPNVESFFDWSANLVKIGRRTFLFLANTQTKYPVIYAGITKQNIKDLPLIIKKTISEHLAYERVQPEVIQKYIDSLGEIRYAKLSDRKMIAVLSRWQIAINEGFAGLKEEKGSCHTMSGIICGEIVKYHAKDDYRIPVEEMFTGLKELWGKSIFSMRAARFRFKIDMMKRKPAVRTITTPLLISFQSLGRIIATTYGWYDETPRFFELLDKKTNESIIISQDPIEEEGLYFENNVLLTDFNLKQFNMRYIRGNDLLTFVEVDFLGILEGFTLNHPIYEFGEGEAPPDGLDPEFYDDFLNGKLTNLRRDLPSDTYTWLEMRIRMASYRPDPQLINGSLERIIQRFPDSYYLE